MPPHPVGKLKDRSATAPPRPIGKLKCRLAPLVPTRPPLRPREMHSSIEDLFPKSEHNSLYEELLRKHLHRLTGKR